MSLAARALSGLLDSKVIVTTDAAGGSGAAAATYFAEQGAALVLTDLRKSSVEEVAQGLTNLLIKDIMSSVFRRIYAWRVT